MILNKIVCKAILVVIVLLNYTAYCSQMPKEFNLQESQKMCEILKFGLHLGKATNIVQALQIIRFFTKYNNQGSPLDDSIIQAQSRLEKLLREVDFDPDLILYQAEKTKKAETIKDAFYVLLNLENQGKAFVSLNALDRAMTLDDVHVVEAIFSSADAFANSALRDLNALQNVHTRFSAQCKNASRCLNLLAARINFLTKQEAIKKAAKTHSILSVSAAVFTPGQATHALIQKPLPTACVSDLKEFFDFSSFSSKK